MATGGLPDGFTHAHDEDTWEKIKKVRRLRELFHGRFPERQCGTLLRKFDWDSGATASFILDAEPGSIREVLGEDEWQIVTVRRDNVIRDLARRNVVGAEIRQYGCRNCDNMWWRKVPTRKPVSRCKMCARKCDPIPENQEWGWAKFEQCPGCQHEFHAFGMMDLSVLNMGLTGKSNSLCWQCRRHLCKPICILRPIKRDRSGRNRYVHACTADNCYNRCQPRNLMEPIVPFCVHPVSLQRHVPGEGSDSHVSTGSTVKTFLSQDELAPPYSPYEPSLADIDEVRSDGSGNGGDDDNI